MQKKADHIGVLVVSARSLVRKGIISALDGEDRVRVKGQASNALELEERVNKLNPDIVIINDDDKGVNSLEAVHLIKQGSKDVRVLLLIKDYDDDKELAALKMGVRGFLPESVGRIDFIRCIRAVNNGEMWVRRRVMEKLVQQFLAANAPSRKRVKRG